MAVIQSHLGYFSLRRDHHAHTALADDPCITRKFRINGANSFHNQLLHVLVRQFDRRRLTLVLLLNRLFGFTPRWLRRLLATSDRSKAENAQIDR